MKFFKKKKSPSIYKVAPQYNTRQKALGVLAALIILIFVLFSFFSGKDSSPSINTSGGKDTEGTEQLKLNETKHTLGTSSFAISTPEGFSQDRNPPYELSVLFKKPAGDLKHDKITVSKYLISNKNDPFHEIKQDLKNPIEGFKLQGSSIKKLQNGSECLVVQYSVDPTLNQSDTTTKVKEEAGHEEYFIDYYIKYSNEVWLASLSSPGKDSLYLVNSELVADSFKLFR